jgi:Inner membrane component of T3SS, cytoplasmic domain/FhaA, N-terminal domain
VKVLVRVESLCSAAVERVFALAFGGSIEPVQIARRLIATIERSPPEADATDATRYLVRVSQADYARFADERAALGRQWARMAATLCERSGIALGHPPSVEIVADGSLVTGTVAIDVERPSAERDAPQRALALRVERGVSRGSTFALPRPATGDPPLVFGRDAACDVVIADPRVSRRHMRCSAEGAAVSFEDLGSSNGISLNGERRTSGELRAGDVVAIGDTALRVQFR